MQQINLYQEQFRRRRDPFGARMLAGAMAAVLLLLVGISIWMQSRAEEAAARLERVEQQRDRVERRVLEARSRLDRLESEDAAAASEPQRLRRELAAKRRLMEYLQDGPLSRRDGFSSHLDGLARRVVDKVWFDRIRFERGGERLRLEGHALEAADVPRMIAALGEESAYAGHAFRSLIIERPEDAEWQVDFRLASSASDDGRQGKSK